MDSHTPLYLGCKPALCEVSYQCYISEPAHCISYTKTQAAHQRPLVA